MEERPEGITTLQWYAWVGDIEGVRNTLKKEGTEINARTPDRLSSSAEDAGIEGTGETALSLACGDNGPPNNDADATQIVSALLEAGADVNGNKYGWQAIHNATKYGLVEGMKRLIEAGAELNSDGNGERTPLHVALDHFYSVEVVRTLLEAGARPDPYVTDERTYTVWDLLDESVREGSASMQDRREVHALLHKAIRRLG